MQIGMAPEYDGEDGDDDDNLDNDDDDEEEQNNVDSQDVTAWEVDSRLSAEFKLDFSTNESHHSLKLPEYKITMMIMVSSRRGVLTVDINFILFNV